MIFTDFFILMLIGIVVSIIVSMVGLGGGIFFIPIFIIFYGMEPNLAVGTSVFCMTMSTLSATIGYYRQKCVDLKLAIAYDVFDIPGIILGAYLTKIIPGYILEIICGIAIIIIAGMVIFKKSEKSTQSNDLPNIPTGEVLSAQKPKIDLSFAWKGQNILWVLISSFVGGLMTGMVGLGGGTVDTTTMILLGVPVQLACGSSSLAMFFINAFGVGTHALLGNILWSFAIPIGIGALIGAQLGSRLATKIKGSILRKLLGAVALFTGIRLIF